MLSLLLSLLLGAIIFGAICILLLVVLGLGWVAIFGIKILIAIGLVYAGLRLLSRIFS